MIIYVINNLNLILIFFVVVVVVFLADAANTAATAAAVVVLVAYAVAIFIYYFVSILILKITFDITHSIKRYLSFLCNILRWLLIFIYFCIYFHTHRKACSFSFQKLSWRLVRFLSGVRSNVTDTIVGDVTDTWHFLLLLLSLDRCRKECPYFRTIWMKWYFLLYKIRSSFIKSFF